MKACSLQNYSKNSRTATSISALFICSEAALPEGFSKYLQEITFKKTHCLFNIGTKTRYCLLNVYRAFEVSAFSHRALGSPPSTGRTWTCGESPEKRQKVVCRMEVVCYEERLRELGFCEKYMLNYWPFQIFQILNTICVMLGSYFVVLY